MPAQKRKRIPQTTSKRKRRDTEETSEDSGSRAKRLRKELQEADASIQEAIRRYYG